MLWTTLLGSVRGAKLTLTEVRGRKEIQLLSTLMWNLYQSPDRRE